MSKYPHTKNSNPESYLAAMCADRPYHVREFVATCDQHGYSRSSINRCLQLLKKQGRVRSVSHGWWERTTPEV